MKSTLNKPEKNQCVVLGYGVPALAVAFELRELGEKPIWVQTPAPISVPDAVTSFLGNGEPFGTAKRVLGDVLAMQLWRLSIDNLLHLQALVPSSYKECAWVARSDEEFTRLKEAAQLKTKGITFHGDKSKPHLSDKGVWVEPCWLGHYDELLGRMSSKVSVLSAKSIEAVSHVGSFQYQVEIQSSSGQRKKIDASVCVVTDEIVGHKFVPSLRDKCLTVTLNQFLFSQKNPPDFPMTLLNGGLDFCYRAPKGVWAGSFRNLYEDKRIGIVHQVDAKSQKAVEDFFSNLGWTKDLLQSTSQVHSFSCDGIPLVGDLPEHPGMFFVGGFMGRASNFIFEVARRLARGIVRGDPIKELEIFSLRRFL